MTLSLRTGGDSGTVVEKSFSNQKVASSISCRSVLEQDTEPLIAPDVQCAISVNVKMCIHPCKSLWIKASAKCKCNVPYTVLCLDLSCLALTAHV